MYIYICVYNRFQGFQGLGYAEESVGNSLEVASRIHLPKTHQLHPKSRLWARKLSSLPKNIDVCLETLKLKRFILAEVTNIPCTRTSMPWR